MKFSNKIYDILKWIAQYLLPAAGTLFFAIATIWDIQNPEKIIGTIAAFDTFLGVLLGISSYGYSGDGDMIVDRSDPDNEKYRLEINEPFNELAKKKSITFFVK